MVEGDLGLLAEEDELLHVHCLNCVTPEDCGSMKISPGCPIVSCPQNCWAKRLHCCKIEDHLTLCPNLLVPCINQSYGCPEWMPRSEFSTHLQFCPASLVVCSMERNREAISKFAKREMKRKARQETSEDKLEGNSAAGPDVDLALSDQRKIQEMYRNTNRKERLRYRDHFNIAHPRLPFLQPISKDRSEFVNQGGDSSDEEEVDIKRKFINSLSPVCRDCYLCLTDPGGQHLHVLGNSASTRRIAEILDEKIDEAQKEIQTLTPIPRFYQDLGLYLNMTQEFLPSKTIKPRDYFTFVCGQIIPRSAFHTHHKNEHSDIVASLDGWLIGRCPLAWLGCNFWTQLLSPNGKKHQRIAYSSTLDTFTLTSPQEDRLKGANCSFSDLPLEIMMNILSRLDPASLNTLALTNKRLRSLVRRCLSQLGMVDWKWIRTILPDWRIRWIPGPLKWTFPNMCDRIDTWRVESNGELSEHISVCTFNERKTQIESRVHVMLPGNYTKFPKF